MKLIANTHHDEQVTLGIDFNNYVDKRTYLPRPIANTWVTLYYNDESFCFMAGYVSGFRVLGICTRMSTYCDHDYS